jgi:hypothetical protein
MDMAVQQAKARPVNRAPLTAAVGKTTCVPLLWIVAGVLPFAVGCVTLDGRPPSWPWSDKPHRAEVTQVVALWADGAVVQPDPARGGIPTPGLAGRVYLFGPDMGEPLEGEGMLMVYLYDDAQPPADQPVPREIWTIDHDNLARIFKKDGLGWGYNLWLPWANYRPDIRKVTLVVQYKSPQGKGAWSGTTVLGMGPSTTASREAWHSQGAVSTGRFGELSARRVDSKTNQSHAASSRVATP